MKRLLLTLTVLLCSASTASAAPFTVSDWVAHQKDSDGGLVHTLPLLDGDVLVWGPVVSVTVDFTTELTADAWLTVCLSMPNAEYTATTLIPAGTVRAGFITPFWTAFDHYDPVPVTATASILSQVESIAFTVTTPIPEPDTWLLLLTGLVLLVLVHRG